jgi:hypothetical protein
MSHRVWLLGAALLAVLGCLQPQTRLQAPDDNERDPEADVLTIGKVMSGFANANPIPVSGVGLVVGLDGTGGDAPPGSYRDMLVHHLQQQGVEHIKEVLASPNNAMVLVSAMVPPGAHKNDPVDVEVVLPPNCKASSLRGGYLKQCLLYTYDSTKNLEPGFQGANRTLLGHPYVQAEGPVLVGSEEEKTVNPRQARIWSGGRCRVERTFYIVMDSEHQSAAVVQRAADRVNETFHGAMPGTLNNVAVAKTKSYLVLSVPQQYRLNVPRYLRVVRAIPLREMPPAGSPYRKRLDQDLLDPAKTVAAALRLEALGHDSISVLKRGLQSDQARVRFASAEALAYLDCTAAGDELAHAAEQQPMFRAYALTALASLDEAVSRVKLEELLASPTAEVRYGAFRALRSLDEHHPAVQGKELNDSFWLHRVATASPGLVHLANSRRPEVVLFGEEPVLAPPFSFLAGEFTVTAPRNDTKCTITRRSVHGGPVPVQCSLKVEDVLDHLAEVGATYPDVVEILHQAGTYHCLSCPLAVDALPQAISVAEVSGEPAKLEGTSKTE